MDSVFGADVIAGFVVLLDGISLELVQPGVNPLLLL